MGGIGGMIVGYGLILHFRHRRDEYNRLKNIACGHQDWRLTE